MTVADPRTRAGPLPRDLVANPRLSRWVRVRDDGVVEMRVGKVELGQGILTALAQVAAEELDVALERVQMLPANTEEGPDEGLTAGSMSLVDAGPAVRLAAANARWLFVRSAARRWGVDPESVVVEDGVLRLADGSSSTADGPASTTYGELAPYVGLDIEVTADVPTKSPADMKLVGSSAARIDLPDKIAGRPGYISDLRLPGMLFGRVVRPPSPGAWLLDVDESVLDSADVVVVRDGSFLGVAGPDEAVVARATETLRSKAAWVEQDTLPDENDLVGFLRAGPHVTIPVLDEGEAPTADGSAEDAAQRVPRGASPTARRVRACYSRPFLAHASMAPSCGIARWEPDGRLSVWSHSQGIHRLRDAIAQALGRDPGTVSVEHAQNAGCYGHNGADDAAFDAVLLARAVPGRPVQVLWSRRDELAWSPFGSAMVAEVEAEVDDSGTVSSWEYDVWSQGHTTRPGYAGVPGLLAGAHLAEPLNLPSAQDPPLATGGGAMRNAVPIYEVGVRRITGHRLLETPIRSSALRSLGAFMNVFAIESFLDEVAAESGQDPLAYRLAHLDDERARTVLRVATEAAGWSESAREPGRDSAPAGSGHGIGFARYKERGAYCAVVAEVEAEHAVRVRRLTIAVDVGRVVNPDGVRNQIEGGATQATSWTLKERVRFDRRRVTSVDWESYPILRFAEAPDIDVHLVDRPDLPSVGAGEAAQGPTAAAIANAVAAAVGVRVRDLPITTEAVVAAIEADDD